MKRFIVFIIICAGLFLSTSISVSAHDSANAFDVCFTWTADNNKTGMQNVSGSGTLTMRIYPNTPNDGRYLVMGRSTLSVNAFFDPSDPILFMGNGEIIGDKFVINFQGNYEFPTGTTSFFVSANGVIKINLTSFTGTVSMVVPVVSSQNNREDPWYATGTLKLTACP
ncbi:MAG TPA: hypothetical protein VKN82_03480 [Desulfohalobiaceae bacterium]|nr:hypothetical protein [Desulfohalobiaceae bacterium]